jgi:ActR/RegA family two-component response regulator
MLRNEDDTSDISVNEIQQKISVHPQKANKENKILPKFRAAPDKRILPPWEVIDDLLQQNGGKITRVAKLIGVTREHLSRELSKRGPL